MSPAADRWNVIVVISDTFRADHLGPRPGHSLTPCLDRFGEQAIRFSQGFAGSYPTLPCRAEIFTGSYVFTYLNWGPLPPSTPVLAETLAGAGYTCTMVTDNLPLCRSGYGYDRGFHSRLRVRGQWYDNWIDRETAFEWPCDPEKLRGAMDGRIDQYLRNTSLRRTETDYFAPQVVGLAERWLEENHASAPFFLYVDIFDPHEPWDPPADYLPPPADGAEDLIYPVHPRASSYASADLQRMRELYAGEVRMVDHWVGRLLDTVDRLDLRRNTVIFFLSDHGILLGERGLVGKMARKKESLRGWPLYPEIAAIPFIVHVPGAAPQVRDDFAQPVDLPATIYHLLGVPPAAVQAGRRLVDRDGAATDEPRSLCISSWSLRGWSVHRPSVIRTPEWSLVYWRAGVRPELYRRSPEGRETADVSSQHPDVVRELHAQYVSFLKAQGTPPANLVPRSLLLRGRSPAGQELLIGDEKKG